MALRYAQDRAEIEDLMSRYLFAMDYGDFDAYVETFTEDGVLEFSRSTSKGRAEIKKAVAAFKESIGKLYKDKEGNPATLRHVLLQAVIRVEADRAWTRSLWVEMANDGPNGDAQDGNLRYLRGRAPAREGPLAVQQAAGAQRISRRPAFGPEQSGARSRRTGRGVPGGEEIACPAALYGRYSRARKRPLAEETRLLQLRTVSCAYSSRCS